MGLFSLVEPGLKRVDALLTQTLRQGNALVAEVSDYLLLAGGKRLRPALVLLAGQFGHDLGEDPEERLVTVATAVEMIHMATLVHDDIIDEASIRRGIPAVRTRFTNPVAVLAGDYLFANAFELFSRSRDTDIVALAARVVNVMCVGEIAQNLSQGKVASETDYWRRIEAKTGFFLESSCRLGAMASDADPEVCEALTQYGHFIGLAYQVVDDLLDWLANPEKLGKAVGGDLAVGIYTLPIIYAREQQEYQAELDQYLLSDRVLEYMAEIKRLLDTSGALVYARRQAEDHVDQALHQAALLPNHPARTVLQELAEFILARDY